jgi:hypothetical protein
MLWLAALSPGNHMPSSLGFCVGGRRFKIKDRKALGHEDGKEKTIRAIDGIKALRAQAFHHSKVQRIEGSQALGEAVLSDQTGRFDFIHRADRLDPQQPLLDVSVNLRFGRLKIIS